MRFIFGLWLLLLPVLGLASPDYAREKRMADEITPSIMVGDPVDLAMPDGRKFLGIFSATNNARIALIVVHGIGVHPDWGIVSTLRTRLAESGYATLSIQMPVLAADAKSELYQATFPQAAERIASAVDFLHGKGYQKIAIVSHSLGARMSLPYVRQHQAKLTAWVALGIGGDEDYAGLKLPMLDVYGEHDLPQVLVNVEKRALSLKDNRQAKQIKIPKSDHFYNQHEDELLKVLQEFLNGIP
jgi:predicted alpha/beta-hydrolase family hydrolase